MGLCISLGNISIPSNQSFVSSRTHQQQDCPPQRLDTLISWCFMCQHNDFLFPQHPTQRRLICSFLKYFQTHISDGTKQILNQIKGVHIWPHTGILPYNLIGTREAEEENIIAHKKDIRELTSVEVMQVVNFKSFKSALMVQTFQI